MYTVYQILGIWIYQAMIARQIKYYKDLSLCYQIIYMGVSTTRDSGETFPTRILTLEIYWRISPVKSGADLRLALLFHV